MIKDPKIFLNHILQSIQLINEYTMNLSEDEFYKLKSIQDAVIRRLEIIGEAVKNLPMDLRNQYSKISWREIAGMRDILIHENFGIDIRLT